ncbi:MAG: YlxR family protein [Candidatus Dormibacteria bacterium]
MTQTRDHRPTRTCVGCRARRPQAELVRFVQVAGGWATRRSPVEAGRGAYLCSVTCAERAKKNRRYPGLAVAAAAVAWDARPVCGESGADV